MFKQAIISFVAAIFIYVSGVLVFATPIPIFYAFSRLGRKTGYYVSSLAVLSLVLASIFGAPGIGAAEVLYFAYFVGVGILFGECVSRGWNARKIGLWTLLGPWFAVLLLFFILEYVAGVPVIEGIKSQAELIIGEFISAYGKSSTLPASQLVYLKNNTAEIVNFTIYTIPASVWLINMIVVVTLFLFAGMRNRWVGKTRSLNKISSARLPFWFVWIAIFSGFMFFANQYLFESIFVKYLSINGIIWSASVYFLQGGLIVAFWLEKKKAPFLRIAIVGLAIFFFQFVGILLIGLGLSDQWIDFRKKMINAAMKQTSN